MSDLFHNAQVYFKRAITPRTEQYKNPLSYKTASEIRNIEKKRKERKIKEIQRQKKEEEKKKKIKNSIKRQQNQRLKEKRQELINEGHSINNINAATNRYGNIKIRTQKELNRIMVNAPNFDPETKRLYKLFNNLPPAPKTKPRRPEQEWEDYKKLRVDLFKKDVKILEDFVNKYNISVIPKSGKEKLKKNLQGILNNHILFLYYDGIDKDTGKRKIENFKVGRNKYKSYLEKPIGEVESPVINPITNKNMSLKEYIEHALQYKLFDRLRLRIFGRKKKSKKRRKTKKKRRNTKKKKENFNN